MHHRLHTAPLVLRCVLACARDAGVPLECLVIWVKRPMVSGVPVMWNTEPANAVRGSADTSGVEHPGRMATSLESSR